MVLQAGWEVQFWCQVRLLILGRKLITWFISKSPTQVSRPLDLTRENQKN
jgi:hypothetical protein